MECDALIGRFHLEDLLTEHRMAGGSYGQLDIGIAVGLDLVPAERRTAITAGALMIGVSLIIGISNLFDKQYFSHLSPVNAENGCFHLVSSLYQLPGYLRQKRRIFRILSGLVWFHCDPPCDLSKLGKSCLD